MCNGKKFMNLSEDMIQGSSSVSEEDPWIKAFCKKRTVSVLQQKSSQIYFTYTRCGDEPVLSYSNFLLFRLSLQRILWHCLSK